MSEAGESVIDEYRVGVYSFQQREDGLLVIDGVEVLKKESPAKLTAPQMLVLSALAANVDTPFTARRLYDIARLDTLPPSNVQPSTMVFNAYNGFRGLDPLAKFLFSVTDHKSLKYFGMSSIPNVFDGVLNRANVEHTNDDIHPSTLQLAAR